ncbi:MAG: Crp/Fnr family transcriptional regulator [Rudanella sp.]|nr:Crp/Fnr family transcriptional regulator [Rudanella sp.]
MTFATLNMTHYYDTLFTYIAETLVLPESDKTLIRQLFKPVFGAKDTIIEPAGRVPQYHNFIVSGFMRNFHWDQQGDPLTVDLNEGSRFFTSYFHFMNRTVSNENIQCLTDCELLRISRDDVDIAASQGITQKDYTVQILNKRLEVNKQRAFDMATLTAEERYRKFATDNPALIRNVPLMYIASYLGITQRHMSRLRKEKSY